MYIKEAYKIYIYLRAAVHLSAYVQLTWKLDVFEFWLSVHIALSCLLLSFQVMILSKCIFKTSVVFARKCLFLCVVVFESVVAILHSGSTSDCTFWGEW